MKLNKYVGFLLVSSLLLGCHTARFSSHIPTATIVKEGWIDCFETNLNEGKTWCEASAILAQHGRVYMANDKDMPAPRTSVFSLDGLPNADFVWRHAMPVYNQQPLLRTAHKFEEFTQSPNGRWVFLTTAFDRIKPGSADFNGYNMLLAWPADRDDQLQVVDADTSKTFSLALRKKLGQALGNPGYFKLEGLAATNNRLWFGIRERGDTYEKFDYRITILSAPYHTEPAPKTSSPNTPARLVLGDVTLVRDFNVADVDVALPKPLAISSIEYDPKRHSFWILTSYEQGDKLGAYLWTISEKALLAKGDLQLVLTPDGKPLQFTHKAEDMTFTDANTLLVIHDDDRVRTRIGPQERQPNQAAYSVVRVN